MQDFRRTLLLAAAATLTAVGSAVAQNPGTCTGNSGSAPLLRSEGQTELMASMSLVCNTVAPSLVSLDVTLNGGTLPLTSRSGEATLTIDNGGVITVVPGTITSLSGGPVGNDMRFAAVPVTSPSPTISILGIRANVNSTYIPLNNGGYAQVVAGIAASSGVLPIVLFNGGLFAGVVYPGLGPVSVSGPQATACGGAITLGAGINFTVSVPELFPETFKIQGPDGDNDSETGTAQGALQADSATQLAVSLAALPPGISFYLPLNITSNGPGTAVLVTGPGSTTPVTAGLVSFDGLEYAPASSGTVYYYNVLSTNASITETFSIPLYNSAATFTSGFTANVTVNLGPAASLSPATVPRFLGAAPTVGLGFTPTATVTPTSVSADSTGGSPQILTVVTPAPGCTWSASEYGFSGDSSWIQLAPTSGTGNGTLTVTFSPNSSGLDRAGSIQVNDASIAASQAFTAEAYADVPPSAYYFDAVNLLAAKGITNGCSQTDFCPSLSVNRAEMAVFIVRSVFGGDNFSYNPTPYFSDVPAGSFGFAWIQKMFELGITNGCGPGLFCPGDQVTRAQMAVFIIRMRYGATFAFDYPPTPYFDDVASTAFGFAWIQRMREDNITAGCAPALYCPDNTIPRGDMAIFIMHGAFNQPLSIGQPVLASISPATITAGAGGMFTVTGVNTNFVEGTTTIAPISGITVGAVTVTSATTLTVQLTAASAAVAQPVSVVAITGNPPGNEEAVLPNGLVIQ